MPCTKFEHLVNLLRKARMEYEKTNKTYAEYFDKLLQTTVEDYHICDSLAYVNQVTGSAVNSTVIRPRGHGGTQSIFLDSTYSISQKGTESTKGIEVALVSSRKSTKGGY